MNLSSSPRRGSRAFISARIESSPRGQHPVARRDLEVAGARVLRQVADRPAAVDLAAERRALPRQNLQRGGLARAVAPDETDAVTGLHAQTGLGQQNAGTGPQFQSGCVDPLWRLRAPRTG